MDFMEVEFYQINHIPNTKTKKMENSVFHKAESRGKSNHGWLESYHTFSFCQLS